LAIRNIFETKKIRKKGNRMALRFYGRNATGLLAGILKSLQRETCVTVRTSPPLLLNNHIPENRADKPF
jgi:hypothetical protein